jgi:signal transduction histidine kinase/ActR/RegA family two-component response regulator
MSKLRNLVSGNLQRHLALLFLLLAAALMGLGGLYWVQVLEPRLDTDARAAAGAIAQSHARNLADALTAAHRSGDAHVLQEAMDEILVLNEPTTGTPFVIGLRVVADRDIIANPATLHRGRACADCFHIEVPLYSRMPHELLGRAEFDSSTAFVEHLKSRVRERLLVGSVLVVSVLLLAWWNVAGLFRRVKASEEAASAAMRVKSAFLATMSHEIRTPMNGVLGMVHLLRDTPLSQQQREYVDAIATSGEALLTILDDVLDLSKIEAGKLRIDLQPMELRRLVADIVLLNSAVARSKGLTLRLSFDPRVPAWVLGDPVRLRQVLQNLVGNALKFTPRGLVELAVEVAEMERAQPGSVAVLFAVRDTGIGVAPADQSRLFEDFSQADSSISRKFGGTGLGLAICKRLVTAMGGRIGVESELGSGSSFFFVLHLQGVEPPHRTTPEACDTGKSGHHPLRVLVAEDGEINRRVVRALLQKEGHTVLEAENGREAIRRLLAEDVDVILMDIQMPEMDGLEAARRIRALGDVKANVPIIALTANALPEEHVEFEAAGMNAYITKPFQPAQLYRALAQLASADGLRRHTQPGAHRAPG